MHVYNTTYPTAINPYVDHIREVNVRRANFRSMLQVLANDYREVQLASDGQTCQIRMKDFGLDYERYAECAARYDALLKLLKLSDEEEAAMRNINRLQNSYCHELSSFKNGALTSTPI